MFILVLADNRHGERVPNQVAASALGRAVELITKEELPKASETWKQVYLCTVLFHSIRIETKDNGNGLKLD